MLVQGREGGFLEMVDGTIAQRPPKWLVVYFLLAAFGVLIVGAALTFNHQVVNTYEDSVS